jgi:hypothetical protein
MQGGEVIYTEGIQGFTTHGVAKLQLTRVAE